MKSFIEEVNKHFFFLRENNLVSQEKQLDSEFMTSLCLDPF